MGEQNYKGHSLEEGCRRSCICTDDIIALRGMSYDDTIVLFILMARFGVGCV